MNLVQADEETSSHALDYNFIEVEYDSEPQYYVVQVESAVEIDSIEYSIQSEANPGASAFNFGQVLISVNPRLIQEVRFRSSFNALLTYCYSEIILLIFEIL